MDDVDVSKHSSYLDVVLAVPFVVDLTNIGCVFRLLRAVVRVRLLCQRIRVLAILDVLALVIQRTLLMLAFAVGFLVEGRPRAHQVRQVLVVSPFLLSGRPLSRKVVVKSF